MRDSNQTSKKLTASILVIVILAVCQCITTLALIYSTISVDNNLFQTGIVKINFNNGEPVIEEHEFLFEPGMTVEKQFFIENESTWDVYYRLYFSDVEGDLAEVLEVSVRHGDAVLYRGKSIGFDKGKSWSGRRYSKAERTPGTDDYFSFPGRGWKQSAKSLPQLLYGRRRSADQE